MKDPKDPGTMDMFDCYDDNVYIDNEAVEERLDKQVKEWLFNSETKKFEEYIPKEVIIETNQNLKDWYEKFEEESK